MTTTVLASGKAVACPEWCDNHYRGHPHAGPGADAILHRQVVGRAEGFYLVQVVAAHDDDVGLCEPYVDVQVPRDEWTDVDLLLRFAYDLTRAAAVQARHG